MERHHPLTLRAAGPVLAAVVAGLLFAPVFGVRPLLLPVVVPALVMLAVTLLCARRPGLVDWRPLLSTLAGLLAVAETVLVGTTVAGLPTGRTLGALSAGVTRSWQLVLQSTWPARPEPELLIFVPLLVTAAAVLGAEILLRLRAPLAALLPSLAVVVLSQIYAALPPGPAVLAALAYAAAAAITLATRAGLLRLAASAAVGVLVASLTLVLLPDTPARYSAQDSQAVELAETLPENPLDEIAFRLAHPATEVFRVSSGSGVDRWPLVVLDSFDGVSWTSDSRYKRFGTELAPGPEVTVEVRRETAEITSAGTGGPWLPSQTWPASVTGAAPRVAPRYGTLALPGSGGVAQYRLSWWQPQVDAEALREAAIDPDAPGANAPIGEVPDGIQQIADEAVRGLRPSFRTALVLEDYLRANYQEAVGENRPTGHAWPQLEEFLRFSKRGTSEQFAAAYVVLARIVGIPARLAVGFRTPAPAPDGSVVVSNRDVLAWPEVAVRRVGWVPLDPIRSAAGASAGSGLAAQAERARSQLPPPEDLREPPTAPVAGPATEEGGPPQAATPWLALLAVPLVPLVGWPVGVPLAWAVRSWWRRRRSGPAAVLGAWSEVRDRLRAYGMVVTPGMTLRDLGGVAGRPVDDDIRALAVVVDRALWSGQAASGEDIARAWACAATVRRGLARRGWAARAWALLNPRPLLPPRVTGRRRLPGWPSAD